MLNNNDEVTPIKFFLSQNYPNPFSKKTVIKYCVAYKTRVQMAVYNTEGEEIEKLVDEEKNPGTYEIEFSACHSCESKNPLEGYYFYRMTAGDFTSEKKWLCINKLSGRINMKNLIQTLFFFLLVTQICFGQWAPVGLEDESIKDIAVYNSLIFAVTSDSGKLYRSTNNGINWSIIFNLGTIDIDISPAGNVFIVKDSIYNSGPPQLFLSSNSGNSWFYLNVMEQIAPHFNNYVSGPYNVSVSPTGAIFCMHDWWARGGGGTAIALSMDNGITWLSTLSQFGGLVYDFRDNSVLTVGDSWEIGGSSGRTICLSEDGGFQWTCWYWSNGGGGTYGPSGAISLCSNGNILAGVSVYGSGIVLSEDTCMSWTQVSTLIPDAGLSIESEGWLVGNDSLGVFLFSDNGDSLGSYNEGLSNLNIHTFTSDNSGYVFAGTDEGVWRRPLSEITAVEEEEIEEVPIEFLLSQNYPNPFNPSTKIKYQIPASLNPSKGGTLITLKVYDILGREITTLVNKEQNSGVYEIEFDARELSSGIYVYQLRAGNLIQTKKMVLIR